MSASSFVIERILPAPPALVFEQWSRAESMAEWMCPSEGMRRASVELDFRVGGEFEIVMHGDQDYRQTGRVLEIEPNRRIVFEWVSHWMPDGERVTRVAIDLEPIGSGETRLVLRHDGLPASDVYSGHEEGWGRILDCLSGSLAARLEPAEGGIR